MKLTKIQIEQLIEDKINQLMEKSKSKAQQRFFGMVRGLQQGKVKSSDVSPEVRKVAKSMSKKDVKDYASTNTKGLPEKVKEENINESSVYVMGYYDNHCVKLIKTAMNDLIDTLRNAEGYEDNKVQYDMIIADLGILTNKIDSKIRHIMTPIKEDLI